VSGATGATGAARTEVAVRVSTLELFFDLVFVFTVTQLTGVLVDELSLVGVVRVLLMLGVIWWMYGGYAWLTNAVALTSSARRAMLLTGMAGFLAIALAIPSAFDGGGWVFGVGYWVVNAVHTGLFVRAAGTGSAAAMKGLAPLNLASATLVLAGGLAPGGWRYAAWAAAMALQIATPYLYSQRRHTITATHFVERHGLVMIIALGESVVAIGVGAAEVPLTIGLLAVAILGLVLVYFLWWAYFGGDDERAEHVLAAAAPERRPRLALRAYGYAHYPMLLGIVVLATGVKKAIGHPFDHLTVPQALALSGGVALFLAGDVWFRRVLGIGRVGYRAVAVLGALAVIPLGPVMAVAQLGALAAMLALLLTAEGHLPGRARS
jgi:low temperature requirement protein LtrA